ncbi:DEAD/DEAH box helicase [Persicobacter diffluens]|uniref:Helicase n=1 Tax=Persicobacter diffluens TaxID=981 RepID=A0AAN5AMZ7_9BACT|nr:helicase [Persicobacter diffluens]
MEKQFVSALKNMGISQLNPMQKAMLEQFAAHPHLQLIAPTGSGKTLAYLLPLVKQLDPEQEGVQALIVSPSRELALQIEKVFKALRTNFKINSVYGGHPWQTELNNFRHTPAVLVGTPGRILDHMDQESFDATTVQYLILDEFDKSLEFGFLGEISNMLFHLSGVAQKVLVSATDEIEIPEFLKFQQSHKLDFSETENKERFTFYEVNAAPEEKTEKLCDLLSLIGEESTIVFCNHKDAVARLEENLKKRGLITVAYHGDLNQHDRERALIKFRNESCRMMITTDLAGRGLDIDGVKHVVHYQLPRKAATFTHRNGRTARVDRDGKVYIFPAEEEIDYLPQGLVTFDFPERIPIPAHPQWETIFFSRGKKDKVNKIDLVGLCCQQGGLEKSELGKIDVLDFCAFVAVKRGMGKPLVRKLQDKKIKKRTFKLGLAR